ncbi:hypothetical protein H0H87_001180 [Tephrocybe sp. NHM501043]|nr:hypothetical protein H0H87_001180 [Tephrocybe sp. NHM501043]
MAVTKLINLIALSSIAILACSYGATPVSALSVDTHHLAARSPSHALLAKKKRSTNSKRCKARPPPSASSTPVATTVAKPTTTPAPATTKAAASPVKAAATTTKASTGSTGGSTAADGKGKVGIAWPQDDDKALAFFKTDKVSSVYTWSPYFPPAAKNLGFQGVPMLWGEKQTSEFSRLVVEGYANAVLGFNELISPAPTNADSGKTWLQNFLKACEGCTVDAIAVHFYGTDPQKLIDYLVEIHNTFGKPIWLTEYACEDFSGGKQCSTDDVWNFMTKTKNFMDNTSWMERYFYFGAMYNLGNVAEVNRLLGSNGQPTDLGWAYIN